MMSVPSLNGWFLLDIRRNRKSFIFGYLSLLTTFVVMYVVWTLFAETHAARRVGLIVLGAPALISSYLLMAQRLRDFGVSGWFALLWATVGWFDTPQVRLALTAAFFLVLCGIPGSQGPNRYGDDPLA
ncbi:DUF805 domain-containing protein [Sphingomonas sp. BK580]|uniref:DUF805 domain-containing protein n=1 Tax=Sphingomonas sp. BK580 TaxID=2586972 RepID=UPI00160F68A6|nr:DUF805 domain-containing protein [Sphingomonas sp. BK580]MBB3693193.1 uncharacterized membrane protein YhaH (DUF805 family) [Sphingomonas sp. BK580]